MILVFSFRILGSNNTLWKLFYAERWPGDEVEFDDIEIRSQLNTFFSRNSIKLSVLYVFSGVAVHQYGDADFKRGTSRYHCF